LHEALAAFRRFSGRSRWAVNQAHGGRADSSGTGQVKASRCRTGSATPMSPRRGYTIAEKRARRTAQGSGSGIEFDFLLGFMLFVAN